MATAEAAHPTKPPRGRELGSQIAGAFGTAFVTINSTSLSPALRIVVIALAVLGLILIIGLSIRSFRNTREQALTSPAPSRPVDGQRRRPASPFGWQYWLIVVVEAVALFGGTRLLTDLGLPGLGVAWVATVVGTHFFALGWIFHLRRFHLLGCIVTLLGLLGFALSAMGSVGAIAIVSGVLSGFALIGFGLWAVSPQAHPPRSPDQEVPSHPSQ